MTWNKTIERFETLRAERRDYSETFSVPSNQEIPRHERMRDSPL